MKSVWKVLSFIFVLVSGFLTIFNVKRRNQQVIAKEVTSFQVKQTLEAIAVTLEKSKKNTKESMSEQENTPLIKANKNARGENIYHVPGGVFYDRTTPVEWFHTEEEAEAAGYRKSAR
ncbi:sunset domain-containing protein [Sutcliffiella rhizosphaerae]|uniref:DNA-entry nuclease n=1 Tax=Sutcliffiella rhizosphaerae TaxID=2880967 RepID=A0ABN8A2S7_9BACI|nr:hypothetical protein [Sutcliffiella rhizosphaerae]CAG9619453.1 hypothetical protein BACCIP111883_00220 [Sutcliffiella rhizosphaerae]